MRAETVLNWKMSFGILETILAGCDGLYLVL